MSIKVKEETKSETNGLLNHLHDNPYLTSTASIQLDPFRCKMKDVLNLYLYMSQPDREHPTIRRPRFLPFLRRNLYYMQNDVSYSLPKTTNNAIQSSNNPSRLNKASNSPALMDEDGTLDGDELLPSSFMSPSLSFYKVRYLEDRKAEYDYADIQCFRSRKLDGQFEETRPVDAAHFHMRLNEELKIDIDLPNFTADPVDGGQLRSDYLLLKVEIRPDGIAVSGGRKLRSVPARQAAQSELKQADDPEHPATTQPEVRIMFGLRRISTQRSDQHGHSIREGKGHIMLIPASQLGVDTERINWLHDRELVQRILRHLKRPPSSRQPSIRVEVFVDDETSYSTAGSALSSARATPAPMDRKDLPSGDKNPSSYSRRLRQRSADLASNASSASETPLRNMDRTESSCSSSASSLIDGLCGVQKMPPVTQTAVRERTGILGVVSRQHQAEVVKAKVPAKLAWCFRMSDRIGWEKSPSDAFLSNDKSTVTNSYLSDPPPADVFRFTENACAICNPEYRRSFPSFIALLYHLCTTHPRLSFKFKKNLLPVVANDPTDSRRSAFSPTDSHRSDSSFSGTKSRPIKRELKEEEEQDIKPELRQCSGLIVSLNPAYNGSHELDSSRHYIKRLSLLRQGTGIRRIPGAWSRPPTFLVVKNLARQLRAHPPTQTIDELESRSHLNDGTFGGCSTWQDPHFHTRQYAQRNAPFIKLMQRRRIRDYVDVNENEKQMLSILSDFHSSFRSLLTNHQVYGWNVILVREHHTDLLHPAIYTQFIIHLSNLKKIGHLHEAEFFDLIARLRHEGHDEYDPRVDSKHFVHVALKQLERQRPASVENHKKNGGRKSQQPARNSRECSTSSTATDDSCTREPYPMRKRSFDGSAGSNSSSGCVAEKKQRLQHGDVEANGVEKKRQFNTQTPIEILLQNTQLDPSQVPITCFDDIACRYQFASDKHLKLIWHFCREWTREYLEWQ